MAITSSAKKAIRAARRKTVFNLRLKRRVHDDVLSARQVAGKERDAQTKALAAAYKAIDKAVKHGTIKKNTAARKKSRLAKFLKRSGK